MFKSASQAISRASTAEDSVFNRNAPTIKKFLPVNFANFGVDSFVSLVFSSLSTNSYIKLDRKRTFSYKHGWVLWFLRFSLFLLLLVGFSLIVSFAVGLMLLSDPPKGNSELISAWNSYNLAKAKLVLELISGLLAITTAVFIGVAEVIWHKPFAHAFWAKTAAKKRVFLAICRVQKTVYPEFDIFDKSTWKWWFVKSFKEPDSKCVQIFLRVYWLIHKFFLTNYKFLWVAQKCRSRLHFPTTFHCRIRHQRNSVCASG